MKTTIKELKALAKRAGVRMKYAGDGEWQIWHPSMWWFTFLGQKRNQKNHAKFILLGIIAMREGLLDKPGYKEIVVQGDESTWHAGEHEL